MELKRGHRYTKEDALSLITTLKEGEKSSKEVYQALEERGVYQKTESDLNSGIKCQRVNSIVKFALAVLGEDAIKKTRKPLHGLGHGGCRSMSYFSLSISPEEAVRRIEEFKPTHSGGRRKNTSTEETQKQEKVVQEVSTQPDPLHIRRARLLRITGEIMDFFTNIQNYSPRQFADLLKRVSTSEFSSQNVIEVIISSFKEAEKIKMEEIEKRYLA
jgi:hypothetical protein